MDVTLVWSKQYYHTPQFVAGLDETTAMDHQRFCLDCHETLPRLLAFDDPCWGDPDYDDFDYDDEEEESPSPGPYLITEEQDITWL